MARLSIFICIPWFHPAFRAGGPVQSIANMVHEMNRDIDFYIFCANTDLNNTTLKFATGTGGQVGGRSRSARFERSRRRVPSGTRDARCD